ncbi:MAG TPA: 2-phospho-L-lactate guanylyltransferase [Nitriliruptorales bacterium]
MTTPTVALVPLRSPGRGKTRLAEVLSVEERAALAGAMLADVVHALRGAGLARLIVVADGPHAAAAAAALHVDVLHDPPGDHTLDDAVAAGTAALAREAALLVVAADLPRLTPRDVHALLDHNEHVVVAPTNDGGTGGLLRRPPQAIATAYGPRSAAHHVRLAREAGLTAAMAHVEGFNHDVDTPADLAGITGGQLGLATSRYLERSGIGARIHAWIDLLPPAGADADAGIERPSA